MNTLTDRLDVPLQSKSINRLSGKHGEFVTYPAAIRAGFGAAAVGLNVSFSITGIMVIDDQEVGTQNRMPIDPEDILATPAAMPGDQLAAYYRNTTAGNIMGFMCIKIIPLG